MKNLLFIILLLPVFAFAQTAPQDTVKIPAPVAKQIVKDLIGGDSAKAELKLATEQIVLLNQQLILKDSIISGHAQKGIMYEDRIKNEQLKFETQGLWVGDLQKQNKKLKTKLTFTKIIGGIIVGSLGYLYITK
jgi:hypothetical protein